MYNIQIISYAKLSIDFPSITCSTLSSPKSLDEFAINMFDLRHNDIWGNRGSSYEEIDIMDDFKHLGIMIEQSKKTKNIFILPLDLYFNRGLAYSNNRELKNMLPELCRILHNSLIDFAGISLGYENTKTKIDNEIYESSFYFKDNNLKVLTKSEQSEKATTINGKKYILTTINCLKTVADIHRFLKKIKLIQDKQEAPIWFKDIKFFNDDKNNKLMLDKKKEINNLQQDINNAKKEIDKNNFYKSILYENGEELENCVRKILGDMLNYPLDDFIDKKEEDFKIQKDNIMFIGEIKGVSTNIKNIHISQLDVHIQNYNDNKQDNEPQGKGLLIINPFCKTDPNTRDSIHETQITLATRNKSLIITAQTLLALYEEYKYEKITQKNILNMFKDKIGLLE